MKVERVSPFGGGRTLGYFYLQVLSTAGHFRIVSPRCSGLFFPGDALWQRSTAHCLR